MDYFEITKEGLNLLSPAFRQPERVRGLASDIYLLVSDGAGQFAVKSDNKSTRSGSASRSMSVLQSANRRKILNILVEATDLNDESREDHDEDHDQQQYHAATWACTVKKNKRLKGFAFTHLAMNLKGRDIGDLRLPSEFIVPTSELRTDLDDFSRMERDALIYHAYTLMKSQLAEHCKKGLESFFPRLQDTSAPPEENPCDTVSEKSKLFDWPPPFVKACSPKCAKSSEARRWISGFLRAGRGLVFRDVLRFPWTFGPILALFMIVAAFFGLSLTGTLAEPSDGAAVRSIAQAVGRAVIAVTPDVNIPDVINLKKFREGFEYNGEYWPALLLVSKLVVLALTFYVALWLYYEFKRWTRLGEYSERRKLNSFIDK